MNDAPYVVYLRARAQEFLNRGATSVEQQSSWLDRYFERDGDFCFIIESVNGASEGFIGLYDVQWSARSAEWGRWVLATGSNAAVESALLIYRFAFDDLSLERVRCCTLAANAKALAFHDSCGLMRASADVTIHHNGELRPAVEHALSRADWPAVRARLDRVASRFAATAQLTVTRDGASR